MSTQVVHIVVILLLWYLPAFGQNIGAVEEGWKSEWAYLTYALLILASGQFLYGRQKKIALAKERQRAQEVQRRQAAEIESASKQLQFTQTQLVHAEKMASLGELTAGIAHEIQNPLNFVNNFAEVSGELVDEALEELGRKKLVEVGSILSDLKQNLKKINHHGGRASGIVRGMLDHSRTDAGEKILTDINGLCDEYMRLAYHGLRAKDKSFNAKMKSTFDPEITEVLIVPQEIGRVLLNLLNNAFYACAERSRSACTERSRSANAEQNPSAVDNKAQMDQDIHYQPMVSIESKRKDDQVQIIITDNGPGIDQETLANIFQPFFTTKPAGEGTGLGLSLSYDIIKSHGGDLSVESEVGKGTAFTIALPISPSQRNT
ncbi:MAG: hypothetical protein KTR24_12870 [Saprospiraceae bacterium]|nr:hypothetical protein [Saprospiraceae bacterium]